MKQPQLEYDGVMCKVSSISWSSEKLSYVSFWDASGELHVAFDLWELNPEEGYVDDTLYLDIEKRLKTIGG